MHFRISLGGLGRRTYLEKWRRMGYRFYEEGDELCMLRKEESEKAKCRLYEEETQ